MKKAIPVILLLAIVPVFFNPEGFLNFSLRTYLSMYGIKFRKVSTDNFSIGCFYSDGGHKQTLLLLHGLGGKAGSSWFTVLPQLSRRFNVLAPDLLLANLVEGHDSAYSIEQDTRLVKELVEKLGIKHVSLVGLSVGGWIAAEFALENPDLCGSLVLIDSAGLDTDELLQRVASRRDDFGRWFYENIFYSGPPVPSFLVTPILRDMDKLGPLCNEFLENNMYADLDLERKLGRIKCPVLIIWGEDDKVIPVSSGRKFDRLLNDSCLVVLKKCGHAAVWDARNELPGLISDFIEGGFAECRERAG